MAMIALLSLLGFERRSHALNVIHGVVDVRGWMDASDQPSSGVATRPSYSLQVNIGRTGKMRDIRLECGYSTKQLVDLLATSASSSIAYLRLGVPGKQSSRRGVWCQALSELAKVIVMPNGEVPSRSELEADECLHCAIINMVDERIAAGVANAVDLTALIAESLVDVILRVPGEQQAQLMAHTLAALGDFFLQKSGANGGGSGSTH